MVPFQHSCKVLNIQLHTRVLTTEFHYLLVLFNCCENFSSLVICTCVSGNVDDMYWYAQALYLTGQYHRAAHCILNKKLHFVSIHSSGHHIVIVKLSLNIQAVTVSDSVLAVTSCDCLKYKLKKLLSRDSRILLLH